MNLGHKCGAPSPDGDPMGAVLCAAFPTGDRDGTALSPPFVRGKGNKTLAPRTVFLGMAERFRDSDLPGL